MTCRMPGWIVLGIGLAVVSAAGSAEPAIDWMTKVYDDGEHNAFTDLISWKGQYYLCFRHGASHLSMDGEIRVMRSTDLKTWEACGTVDTLGDDRDPHFTTNDQALYVFFGTWDLMHDAGNGVPGRGKLRSHFASSADGVTWSKVQGVYEPLWWLWRVRWHQGAFYSVAYYLTWPATPSGEAKLLRSEDALHWTVVSTISKDFVPDEADFRFLPDGSMETILRTCAGSGNALWAKSDPTLTQWQQEDAGALVHSPGMVTWKNRCFVAGRGKDEKTSVTRLWELVGHQVQPLLTLPSSGDTAYPGLIIDPATANAERPAFFITWYSQHERATDKPNQAAVYVARITL